MPHALVVIYSKCMVLVSALALKLVSMRQPIVYAGEGSAARLCDAMAQFGHRRVLVVTDKMLVELGVVEQAVAGLRAADVEVEIFDEVQPDPDFEQVEAGIDRFKQSGCDAVLAVGGGSSLDAAKVIAICGGSDQEPRDLTGYFSVKSRGCPSYSLPTTAGTGSEVTMVSVLTDRASNAKQFIVDPKLVPDGAALDPGLMLGLPPAITAATGMDALTHAIESALSKAASEETLRLSLAASRLIFENIETAVTDGKNVAAREAMALGSCYAGSAFTVANVGYVHGIAHQLGALYHVPHGLANALVLPHVLFFYVGTANAAMARIAVASGLGERGEGDRQLALRLVESVANLQQRVGLPATLEALKREDIPMIIERALTESHGAFGYPVPKYLRPEECEQILEKLLP